MPVNLTRRSLALATFASLIFLLFSSIYQYPANFEDSFITYRYIDAINATGGFFWNYDGKAVYGMTGLVFPLISSALSLILRNPIISASIVGTAAGLFTIIIMATRARSTLLSRAVVVILATSPIFVRGASNGLETSLAALFIVSVYLIEGLSRNWFTAALVTLAGFYIRPDIILISYALIGLRYAQAARWRSLLLYNIALALLLLAGIFSAYLYFGNALPLPSSIKIDGIGIIGFPKWILSQYLIFPFLVSSALLVPVGVLLCRGAWESPKDAILLLFPLALFFCYQITTLPVMNVGYRFAAPIIAGLCSSALIIEQKLPCLPRRYCGTVIVASIVLTVLVSPAQIAASKESSHDNFASLGSMVSGISGLHIASSEAGKFAFYSAPSQFFDTIGLNSDFVAKNFRNPRYFEMLKYHFANDSKFPDLYVRGVRGIGAGTYAYLENLDGFEEIYSCQEARQLKICVLSASPRNKLIIDKIETWKSNLQK